MNDLDLCLEVVSRSCQPLRYIRRWMSGNSLQIEAWFQRTTNRKWHMGYQMVTWPMTHVTPKGAVQSAILATAWLLVEYWLCSIVIHTSLTSRTICWKVLSFIFQKLWRHCIYKFRFYSDYFGYCSNASAYKISPKSDDFHWSMATVDIKISPSCDSFITTDFASSYKIVQNREILSGL